MRVPATVAVFVVTVAVEIGLRTMSLPALTRRLGIALDLESGTRPRPGQVVLPTWARAQVAAVDAVLARWPFGDTCLRHSLVLGHRLRGRDPVLRVGVRRTDDAGLGAHAWLEIDGQSLDPSSTDFGVLAASRSEHRSRSEPGSRSRSGFGSGAAMKEPGAAPDGDRR